MTDGSFLSVSLRGAGCHQRLATGRAAIPAELEARVARVLIDNISD